MSCIMDQPQLPSEIWLVIFGHLDSTKIMAECRLVCKNWKPLADQYLYKSISVNCNEWTEERLHKLTEHLYSNPGLCHLIHTIDLAPFGFQEGVVENFLKQAATSNIRVLKGLWTALLMEKFLSFLKTSNIKLDKLEQLPSGYVSQPFVNLLLHFKESLKSASFSICDTTDRVYTDILSTSFGEFKILKNLKISNDGVLRNVQELDNLWKACVGIEQFTFVMKRRRHYALTDSNDLKRWLSKDVQTSEATAYVNIRVHRKPWLHVGVGPELIHYLVHKCPNINTFNVHNIDIAAQQHALTLPHLSRLEAFDLTSWRFQGLEQLIHFIEVSRGRENTIRLKYDIPGYNHNAYICDVNAKKERGLDQTDYSLLINGSSDIIDTNTVNILSLFSACIIRNLCFDGVYRMKHRLIIALMYFPMVECLIIEANHFHFEQPPQQFRFHKLKRLEIRHADITASDLTEFCNLAPDLQHVILKTCFFEHQICLASASLISLTLEAYYVDAEHNGYNDYEDCGNALFHISIAASTYQFLASPHQPLLLIPTEATVDGFGLEANITIKIQCKTLQSLKVDLADFKFEMDFDGSGQVKSSNPAIETSSPLQNAI